MAVWRTFPGTSRQPECITSSINKITIPLCRCELGFLFSDCSTDLGSVTTRCHMVLLLHTHTHTHSNPQCNSQANTLIVWSYWGVRSDWSFLPARHNMIQLKCWCNYTSHFTGSCTFSLHHKLKSEYLKETVGICWLMDFFSLMLFSQTLSFMFSILGFTSKDQYWKKDTLTQHFDCVQCQLTKGSTRV